ncbi:MAG: type II toxin-antitoxin system VapC family toxin [Candidatus Wallbacteria bacterium]|nr:type II toxin-antitoxin system VapC family toxin [Candidatus Wallbacteria bacterium]
MATRAILVDTSLLIEYFRAKNKENTQLLKLSTDYSFAISTITVFEFLSGFKTKGEVITEYLLKSFRIVPFDYACAESAAEIFQHLKSKNRLIPPSDIFIAASAITCGLELATLNLKHFKGIKNLALIV